LINGTNGVLFKAQWLTVLLQEPRITVVSIGQSIGQAIRNLAGIESTVKEVIDVRRLVGSCKQVVESPQADFLIRTSSKVLVLEVRASNCTDLGIGQEQQGRRQRNGGGGRAEPAKELRKSGERGSGRRSRQERRVSEGRYGDFERSDDGGVKGPS